MNRTRTRAAIVLAGLVVLAAGAVRLRAQDRFLGKQDILLYGFGLQVAPDHQVVPKDIATIVSAFLAAGTPPGSLPPFAPDAVMKGTLYGPGYPNGLDIAAQPNTPFTIPPIGVAGTYTFENIRLESGGEVVMHGVPESVTIEVIEKLLVTQVTARALTAQEVRDKGIVFDKSSFQAYNFTAAFAVQDTPVRISFPVVLPSVQSAQGASVNTVDLSSVPGATLPQLQTIIPDTLKLQTQIPNLQVVGFTLQVPELEGKQLLVPPIPGVVVIPGDIGFLDQFFSAMLMVGNVAPPGSNLVVSNLAGEILLPAGNDTIVGTDDDPLRMANTTSGPSPKIRAVVQPGPDGKLGTADDIPTLGPGESGSAEYLVEGRREGSWTIEFNISGTLTGLPVGPVTVTGRAAGSVLVRNPNFTLTFTHPSTVSAGEPYTLDVTVSNTSPSPANVVTVNLFAQNISGAALVGDPVRSIDTIAPGDSATVHFDLVARVTGKVTAATLDSDDKVQGRFALKTAVGELGVPVSPDTLVLPTEADGLPSDLRTAAIAMLGKAWAVATAPSAALPASVQRFSKQIVYDRAVQAAEAGFRIALHEPVPDSAVQLEMDFAGSDFSRLQAGHPDPDDLQFTRTDFTGFDALRRQSVRGDALAAAVGALLAPDLAANGAGPFHRQFSEKVAYRPPHLSIVVSRAGGPLPFDVSLVDPQGRRLGGIDANGKAIKEIPFADLLPFQDSSGALTGEMLLLTAPDPGQYRLRFSARAGVADAPFSVSIVVPDGAGGLRQIGYDGVTGSASPASPLSTADPYSAVLELPIGGTTGVPISPSQNAPVVAPLPHVMGVVQQAAKDLDGNPDDVGGDTRSHELGRIVAVLFNQEIAPESVQDRQPASAITSLSVDDNGVAGVALQPGRRIAFLALRDPIGPFVPRQLTISGVVDGHGRAMGVETVPIETTVTRDAAVVTGQVIDADGTPVPFASVRLFVTTKGGFLGVSSKPAGADGRFSWDWVPSSAVDRVLAVNPVNDDHRSVDFTVQRDGQRLTVNVVFLGRGTVTGRTLAETGAPLANTAVRVTSLTDQSQYSASSDTQGRFAIARVPVGNVLIDAVNVAAHAQGRVSDLVPLAGATIARDITLFDVSAPAIIDQLATVSGHVLRGDGSSTVADVPVVAYYQDGTQTGVFCPNHPLVAECAVAAVRTDANGAFSFVNITAGQLRLASVEASSFQQGEARVTVPGNGFADVNILYAQGLGTVAGTVLDAGGQPVAGARVGGGLSLVTTDGSGHFTLTDVPLGHREIVAVSDQIGTTGRATIDVIQPGQIVNVVVVLPGAATIAGTVYQADGVTPVPANKVYLFHPGGSGIIVDGSAVTDADGRYSFARVPIGDPSAGGATYQLSAFRPDFSDGNVQVVALKYNNQVFRGDIVFRGGGGHVTGHVFDADGATPLRAAVGISGDQVVVAGGLVGTGFQRVAYYQIANTDLATGSFSFANVLVGPLTLSAVGQFSPDPITFEARIPSPGASVQVDLRLQATSRIQGTVLLPDGVTPAGRNVIVRFQASAVRVVCATTSSVTVGGTTILPGDCAEIPQGIQNETAVTDDSGHYELPLVNAGSFTLIAEDPVTGKSGRVLGTTRPGQSSDFSIRLLGVSALRINVRGSDSTTPIPGARVEVKQIGFPAKTLTTLADAGGTVLLNGGDAFAEGDVVVTATDVRTGFTGRASGKVTKDSDTITINVYLFNATGSVFGFVYKADGLTPVPNAEVTITGCGDPQSTGACTPAGALAFLVTDASGAYRQDQMPLGPFNIEVFEAATARQAFASGRIDFNGQQVPLDVVETGRGLVTGTALAAGTLDALKNWEVRLSQTTPGGRFIELLAASDVDGTFSFPGVSVGAFQLVVRKFQNPLQPDEPYGLAAVTSRITGEGQHVDVPVVVVLNQKQFGRVEGVVFNADGTTAANVSIAVCPNCDPVRSDPALQQFAQTASDGSFAIDRVPIGRFFVFAKDQTSLNTITAAGELLFEGDLARLTLTLVGLSRISGTVEFSDGRPATAAQVTLYAQPSSGCAGDTCTVFTDGAGRFAFTNIPGRTFWIRATDAVSGLSGTVSGALDPGDQPTVRIVLQPSGSVSGRVLFARGAAASGISAALDGSGGLASQHLFQVSDQNGNFSFQGFPLGTYTLTLQDPLGPGIAVRTLQVAGPIALGDVTLDEALPVVGSTTPAASATGVPLGISIRIVFSKRIDAATATQSNLVISGPAGRVFGGLQLTDGDTALVFTPLAPLAEQTRYTIAVQKVADLFGRTIAPYSASFVTVDLTPPSTIELTPLQNSRGIALATTIRVRFSEPVDPTRFSGAPIALTKAGAAVAGRTDFVPGNTGIVFTPTLPLDANADYQVQIAPATDLSGNAQAQGLTYAFHTVDQTPPQVTALTASGNGSVIENATTQVIGTVDANHDIAVVDFYLNDQPAFAARTAPFTFSFQATPNLGKPGDQIKVSAFATDTSGNRSPQPASIRVPVIADALPTVVITAPGDRSSFRTGERVAVTIHVTDDLGVTQAGYRAQTGNPQDASVANLSPASADATRSFAFTVPQDAAPGASIVVNASATDTKGQLATAAPVSITVVDATPPTVSITGTTTGARVSPGQPTTAIVLAQDLGGVAAISFTTGGVLVGTQTQPVSPAQNSVAASFSFTVPDTAHPGDTLTLDATATDAAGNVGSAARILLPVADLNPPLVRLSTSTGATEVVPGTTATIILSATDDTAVASASLQGQGAFSFATARQVTPSSNSAELSFAIQVPAGAPEGATLNVVGRATDVFGNVSAPAPLALAVRSSVTVTLPSSVIIEAGDQVGVNVQLGAPAGAGGVRVDLRSDATGVATVDSAVAFAEGESSHAVTVTGVAGGVASITASVNGVTRASMTATVRGGVVTGVVVNDKLQPVAGVNVAVTSAFGGIRNAVTDQDGRFSVEGVGLGVFTSFTVKTADPVTHAIGYVTGALNVPDGFARVTVVLVSAGSIAGTVVLPDGHTPAPSGVRVDLFAASEPAVSLGTVFTAADGSYVFPIVSLGTYVVEASDVHGNRGLSSTVVLSASGQQMTVTVAFLGRGIVTGIVRDGGGNPVANVPVTLGSTSLFGYAPAVQANAQPDGTFRFDNVLVGSFTVQARDPITSLAGTAAGAVQNDGQVVSTEIVLAPWGTLQGTVFRPDGATPVPGATVTLRTAGAFLTATTDAAGRYTLPFVPLGTVTLEARDQATQGFVAASATLAANGQIVTKDLTLLGQGTLIVTVRDGAGVPVPAASIVVEDAANFLFATADASGVAIVEHVIAGDRIMITASSGAFVATVTTPLQPDEVRPITVAFAATGNIAGTVFLPDGQTPAAGGSVAACAFSCIAAAVNADGTYLVEGLQLNTWTLTVVDANSRRRAIARNVVLSTAGQTVTANLRLAGIGTVAGRVLNPDGSSASGTAVTVRSLDPDLGSVAQVLADGAGFYRVDDVIAGAVAASAGDSARALLGEATGTLAHDGDTLTLDILLRNNAVTLPVMRNDANFFTFDVQRDGSLGTGSGGIFAPECCPLTARGADLLDVISNGTAFTFSGASIGTTEDFGRQVVMTQNGLAGLNITRKILTGNAYFGRYVELLTNPTTVPIVVDVRLRSHVKTSGIFQTSSGDDAFDVGDPGDPDRWVMFTEFDTDSFVTGVAPQIGFAFDGAGARRRAAIASYMPTEFGSGDLQYGWTGVTIQPGQTAAFMHFTVQQYSRAAEKASLERLAQLPPEALEGLSPPELAAIQNFDVAADGSSRLEPLPPFGGAIGGRVFEADAATPVPFATVRLRSANVFFGRVYTVHADVNGSFSFGGATTTIPLDGFSLEAVHPVTRVTSASATGSLSTTATTASRDIVFSNTGIVRGRVRRTSGQLVSGATITASSAPLSLFANAGASAGDGSYFASGLPAGDIQLTAALAHPQGAGFSLTGTTTVTVEAGQIQARDIVIEATGSISGTVRTAQGGAASNALVIASGCDPVGSCFSLQTRTDSSGIYRFTDAPTTSVTVSAFDPNTNFPVSGTVAVVRDQTSTLDLTFVGTGSIAAVVRFANGLPAPNVQLQLVRPSGGSIGVTDANGRATVTSVLPGQFVLRAYYPNSSFTTFTDVTGTLSSTGQTVNVSIVLPPAGSLVVQVLSSGAPVPFARVDTDISFAGSLQQTGLTDANGRLTMANVPGGRTIQVVAYEPCCSGSRVVAGSIAIAAEGQTATITLSFEAAASIAGIVTKNGAPIPGVTVYLSAADGVWTRGTTAAPDGSYAFSDVPLGGYRVTVRDAVGAGSAAGQLVHDGDAANAPVALTDVQLPTSMADANGFIYNIGTRGDIGGGSFASFSSLNVGTVDRSGNFFIGDQIGQTDLNGRQLTIANYSNAVAPIPMAGVNVTRRVYVDPSGYFARVLEVLDNPASSPAIVALELFASSHSTQIVATSSGSATPSTADQWFVTGSAGTPASYGVFVFAGSNASLAASRVDVQNPQFPVIDWSPMIVPAGGRVLVMHFEAQAPDQASAVAIAQRLAQLPPEALTGITPADLAAIQNFTPATDGSSALPPLASISGRVFAADGVSPAPNVQVLVTGNASSIFEPTAIVLTDASGRYLARTLVAGPVTVQGRDPNTGALTAAFSATSDGHTPLTRDLMFTTTGVVTGRVLTARGLALAGAQVNLSNQSGTFYQNVYTAADGRYTFAIVPPGSQYTAQAFTGGRFATAGPIAVASGQVTTADLTLPAVATVRLTITQDGAPVVGAHAYLNGDFAGDANGAGVLSVSVVAGPFAFQIYAPDYSSIIAAPAGSVGPGDDGTVIDIAVRIVSGSVSGTVYAGDGSTPMPNVRVLIVDPSSNTTIAQTSADADGHYLFAQLLVSGAVAIVAQGPPRHSTVVARVQRSFDAASSLVVDLSLPLAIIRGRVLQADGATGVPLANVSAAHESSVGAVQTEYATADANGAFTFFAEGGPFDLLAYDDKYWYAARAATTVTTFATQTLDLVLPPLGRVTGVVRDAQGSPVPSATVVVESTSTDLGSSSRTRTDASGAFSFDRVPSGPVSLQACAFTTAQTCAHVDGVIAGAGQFATIDVTVPGFGTLTGIAYASDGVTPLPFTSIQVVAGEESPLGVVQRFAVTDGSGQYSTTFLPAGPVSVILLDRFRDSEGIATGVLTDGGSTTLNVVRGTASSCYQTWFDAAGFEYDANCAAELSGGGTADGRLQDAYGDAYTLRVNGNAATSPNAARLELSGQQAVYGPFGISGVSVTRKLFVPAGGRFARYLDTLTNSTSAPLTLDVQIESAFDGVVHVAVDPVTTGDTYAITVADPTAQFSTTTRPALGHVFGALTAPVRPAAVAFQVLQGTSYYRWTVTIAPGDSMTFMHFALQGDPGDPLALDAQARALVDLSDPNALAGMTAAEKARVVNFVIP